MKRRDLLTKEEFVPSRITQKFAKPENRIKYYNNKANEYRHSVAYINKPLQSNIRLLIELMNDKTEAVFHKEFMLGKGYDFNFHTHVEKYDNKKQFAVHNYLIWNIEDNQVKIVKYK